MDGETVGIAILNHPESFPHPTTWHVRDYGLFGANPFAHSFYKSSLLKNGAYTVNADDSLLFQYRIYLHRDDPRTANVSGKWSDYAFPPTVKVES